MPEPIGPWYLAAQNDGLFVIDRPPSPDTDYATLDIHLNTKVVASVPFQDDGSGLANGHVLAAAPELLKSLQALLRAPFRGRRPGYVTIEVPTEVLDDALAAWRKARDEH